MDDVRVVADGLEDVSEPGDMAVQAFPCLGGRIIVPGPADEGVHRHRMSRRQQENGEDAALSSPAGIVTAPIGPDFDRTDNTEFHLNPPKGEGKFLDSDFYTFAW